MKILNLTTAIPSKYGTGADIASRHFIEAMRSLGHMVCVVGYQRWGDSNVHIQDAIVVGERHIETKSARWHPIMWTLNGFLRQLPYTSSKYYSSRYLETVKKLLAEEHYDAIVLEHSSQLCWLKPAIAQGHKLAVLAHNLEHAVFKERIAETQKPLMRWMYQRESKLTQKMEDFLAASAASVWTLSQEDAAYFTHLNKVGSVKAFGLPSTVVQPTEPSDAKTFDIGMIGSWMWKPNQDGLRWFFEQVYPLLPKTVSMQVAGRGADWLIDRYPNVKYCGFVENAQDFLAQARVVPLASVRGSGVQIKTLEAIGQGLPIVATPLALRNISNPPLTVRQAETPEAFAHALQDAIAQTTTAAETESVQVWLRDRRAKFLLDVDTALSKLG